MTGQSIWRWGWLAVAIIGALSLWQFSTSSATAQGGSGGTVIATRIAVLDAGAVFENLDETGGRQAELNQFIAERENEIKAITDELQAIQTELDTMQGVISTSDPKFIQLRNRAVRAERQFRFEREFARRQIEERQVQIQLEMFNRITAAAARYAERQGIDLVLADDSNVELPPVLGIEQFNAAISTRRVLHANDAIDITEEVTQMMNNDFAAGR